MKKTIHTIASLLVLASCTAIEPMSAPEEGTDLGLRFEVEGGGAPQSRALYDGNNFMAFEAGDQFMAAIAKHSTPTLGVKVATEKGGARSDYGSCFTIDNESSLDPVFYGHFYNIAQEDLADEYSFYGVFPAASVKKHGSDLTSWTVTIPSMQKPTQMSWAGIADPMVVEPVSVSAGSSSPQPGGYDIDQDEKVRFAHLFGFGKISFTNIPALYSSLLVQSISITATGEKKDLAGDFNVDITKRIKDIAPEAVDSDSTITIAGDGITSLANYSAWFVANPGVYDVRILVKTSKGGLVFNRRGLTITRSTITSPVVTYKTGTDLIETYEINLNDLPDLNWKNTMDPSKELSNHVAEAFWGDSSFKMGFTLTHPGATDGGMVIGNETDGYAQQLVSGNFNGTTAELMSSAPFIGMRMIKIVLGNHTTGATNDFIISVENGSNSTTIATIEDVQGDGTKTDGDAYFYTLSTNGLYGNLKVTATNLSGPGSTPYVGIISLNPPPEIIMDSFTIHHSKDAAIGHLKCYLRGVKTFYPNVYVNDSWITASYSGNKLHYTLEENTTGETRTGTVRIVAHGITDTEKIVTFIQEG